MYNNYASEHAYWSDTTNMDNLRGADATGKATPGAMEGSATPNGVSGFGNTRHTYSGDDVHVGKCSHTLGVITGHWFVEKGHACDNGQDHNGVTWIRINPGGSVFRNIFDDAVSSWVWENGNTPSGYASMSSTCDQFNFQSKGVGTLSSNGIIVYDPDEKSIAFYGPDGTTAQDKTYVMCY